MGAGGANGGEQAADCAPPCSDESGTSVGAPPDPETTTGMMADDRTVAQVSAHSVACGNNYASALGHAGVEAIGDDELPSDLPLVDVGGPVVDVAAGASRTCALLDSCVVRCRGENYHESLGISPVPGHLRHRPAVLQRRRRNPAMAPPVDVGAPVVALSIGGLGTCALTDTDVCAAGAPTTSA